MSDWRDDEYDGGGRDPDEESSRPAGRGQSEGVRILGADEAQAALDTGQAAGRKGGDEPRFGDVPPRPDPTVRPAARFPLPDDDSKEFWGERTGDYEAGPTWSAASQGLVEPESNDPTSSSPAAEPPATSGEVRLPHWTEPPTGEVPRIVTGGDDDETPPQGDGDEELDAWASVSGQTPRYRVEANDWAEGDFAEPESLKDDSLAVGALDDTALDDDEAFEEQVQARRRVGARGGRGRGRVPRTFRRASLEDGAPPPPEGGPAPDLVTRVLTGVAVAVVALIMFKLGRGPAAFMVSVIVGAAALELYEAFRRAGYHPASIVGVLGSVAMVWVAYKADKYGLQAFPLISFLVIVFTMLWYMAEVVKARPIVNIAITLFGFAYVGILGGFGGLLLSARDGTGLLIGLAICAVGYDVAGYLIGSQFGRSRMAPRLSPNKTWEGLFGGMAASIVLGGLVSKGLSLAPWDGKLSHGLALGLVVAIVAPIGDLCESMIKRDLGLKDLGTLLPGHGGVLDRFDALLFCLPAVYYLALQLKIG